MFTDTDKLNIDKVAKTIEEILDLSATLGLPHKETARRIAYIIAESTKRAFEQLKDDTGNE